MNAIIIRDFLWRRWLLIGIVSIAHFIIYTGPVAKGYDSVLVLLFFIGIMAFSPALTKEMVRQILLLPVERACLVKTYWGISVALPTVLFMFLGIIATLFTPQLPRSAILQIPAVAFAWFSLVFFADRFRFLIRQSSFKRKIFYGTITLIGILVALFASNIGQLRAEHFFAISRRGLSSRQSAAEKQTACLSVWQAKATQRQIHPHRANANKKSLQKI